MLLLIACSNYQLFLRKLTPSHTTCNAYMNQSFAFYRDVSLGHLCSCESALELSQEALHLSAVFLSIY